jgi:hypothetical protein
MQIGEMAGKKIARQKPQRGAGFNTMCRSLGLPGINKDATLDDDIRYGTFGSRLGTLVVSLFLCHPSNLSFASRFLSP